MENPELILVFEVAGTVKDFANAVSKVPGLDWLLEWAEEEIAPDDDFYIKDKKKSRFLAGCFCWRAIRRHSPNCWPSGIVSK